MLYALCRNSSLQLIPIPTPRWPDLLCVYHPTDKLLFTSNLFSAHVAPSAVNTSGESAGDVGGWDLYGQDWRHYYDCMLAPVAKQAAGNSPPMATPYASASAVNTSGESGGFGNVSRGGGGKGAGGLTFVWPSPATTMTACWRL